MLAEERKALILDLISLNKVVKVADLSKELRTTEATVRRDLEDLQKQRKVRRVHGGATSVNPTSKAFMKSQLVVLCIEEKKRIARKAYEFIDDGDALVFDASTTVLELAKLIVEGERTGLSIITDSFSMIPLLAPRQDLRVFHTGGRAMHGMDCAVGPIAENMLEAIKVDKCFVGTNGIDPAFGYSTPMLEDAAIKKCMLRAAKLNFVLADHTKFGESYMGKFANFTGTVDYLITDELQDRADLDVYASSVNLITA